MLLVAGSVRVRASPCGTAAFVIGSQIAGGARFVLVKTVKFVAQADQERVS